MVLTNRAGPSRCGAPLSSGFYDVIVFSQPCYTTMVERRYNVSARELSTFANVR